MNEIAFSTNRLKIEKKNYNKKKSEFICKLDECCRVINHFQYKGERLSCKISVGTHTEDNKFSVILFHTVITYHFFIKF